MEVECCKLFASLGAEEKQWLAEQAEYVQFSRGEIIYEEKCFRRCLGVVLEGEAIVRKEHGPPLNLLRVGDCFGAAALFAPLEEYVTTVEAHTPCRVAFLPDATLQQLFLQCPQAAMEYIRFLSGRVQFLNRKIDSFTQPNVQQTVQQWLERNRGENGMVQVQGGYARLARALNVSRASLYRCLGQMEQEGILHKQGDVIRLCARRKRSQGLHADTPQHGKEF